MSSAEPFTATSDAVAPASISAQDAPPVTASAIPEATPHDRYLPGDVAMWFFIVAELLVFACFFIAYGWYRANEPSVFAHGQAQLHIGLGAFNTIVLILGGLCAATAAQQARAAVAGAGNGTQATARALRLARRCLLAACAFGLVFVVCKLTDFGLLFKAGHDVDSDDFWMFYFSLTFFHFMHVLLGMVILLYVYWPLRKLAGKDGAGCTVEQAHAVESGASYWHMVDMVWLVLFALVYIARQASHSV
ncbi:MAG: cytochrome c oxidase subunit 3 family protein [Paraburkholderia sp.]|nr:MAG: cytochrome c oxidase subunit 3 family protein [Paraburkholderia sp.]